LQLYGVPLCTDQAGTLQAKFPQRAYPCGWWKVDQPGPECEGFELKDWPIGANPLTDNAALRGEIFVSASTRRQSQGAGLPIGRPATVLEVANVAVIAASVKVV